MTEALTMAPDEQALRSALTTPAFQSGVDDKRWRLVSLDWPIGLLAISASSRGESPTECGLRIDFVGYPQQAPTAEPWSLDRGERLGPDERPKGERAAHAFRCDWEDGRALYVPWDRVGLAAHGGWATQYPTHAWHPGRDVVFFLRCVYDLLNDDDYLGT